MQTRFQNALPAARLIVSTLLALSLGANGMAWAQVRGDRDDERGPGHGERGSAPQQRSQGDHRQQQKHGQMPQHSNRNAQRGYDQHDQRYQGGDRDGHGERDGRGVGPNHGYYRGQRMPLEYRSHQYVVDDWRGHHLSAPPRGYHWVQSGGDYVLVAIATGVILQLLLNGN